VIIATPGRLADHIKSGTPMHLSHLQFLVLDEADRLFEDCFQPVA
jgi:superfamily II DNA/RNA helicase